MGTLGPSDARHLIQVFFDACAELTRLLELLHKTALPGETLRAAAERIAGFKAEKSEGSNGHPSQPA